jgi:F0F1-type ATP synthase assembly protein I
MRFSPPDPGELRRYFALSQVGLEMVAPIGVGLALDYGFGWGPWGAVIGALVGFVGGLTHLIVLVSRPKDSEDSKQVRKEK